MFAMLTGCFPFKGEDKDKTFVKILRIQWKIDKLVEK